MPLNLIKYLLQLRADAIKFERTDLNGKVATSFWLKNTRRIVCMSLSIGLVIFIEDGFSSNFISYASTVLSVLIGLFISAMIFSFDKFYKRIDLSTANATEKLWDTQSYNYSKQFAYITGYNIVMSIFAIALLTISALFEKPMSINLHNYVFTFDEFSKESILTFVFLSLITIQRVLILYWTACVMYNTLFLVSSMVKFMTLKLDRNND
jgi:hypothetical protein